MISGLLIKKGFKFRVLVDAENKRSAISKAKSLSDGICSFITILTGIGTDVPKEEIVYEVTPNVKDREFMQIFYDSSIPNYPRRQLSPSELIKYINKYTNLPSKYRPRIARALRWYRLGIKSFDIFDRFNCYWIGLESLNPILQEKLSIASTRTISGIRQFIKEQMTREKLYRKIRECRIKIMHSTTRLHQIHEETAEVVPELSEVLFRAICYVLDFKKWKTTPKNKILYASSIRGEMEGILHGGRADSLGQKGEILILK